LNNVQLDVCYDPSERIDNKRVYIREEWVNPRSKGKWVQHTSIIYNAIGLSLNSSWNSSIASGEIDSVSSGVA